MHVTRTVDIAVAALSLGDIVLYLYAEQSPIVHLPLEIHAQLLRSRLQVCQLSNKGCQATGGRRSWHHSVISPDCHLDGFVSAEGPIALQSKGAVLHCRTDF